MTLQWENRRTEEYADKQQQWCCDASKKKHWHANGWSREKDDTSECTQTDNSMVTHSQEKGLIATD